MESKKLLIVGLGNPGTQYEKTRHNIGFQVLDEFTRGLEIVFDRDNCSSGKISRAGTLCIYLKPMEFMNLSGNCVGKFLGKFKISTSDLLVLHDELDFPFGTIKYKNGGGHAGHNGLRSIIDTLGTKEFSRLRIGIGRPPSIEVSNYVLSNFSKEEEASLPQIKKNAFSMLENWLTERTKSDN